MTFVYLYEGRNLFIQKALTVGSVRRLGGIRRFTVFCKHGRAVRRKVDMLYDRLPLLRFV